MDKPVKNDGKRDIVSAPMTGEGDIDFEIIELLFFAYRDFISDPDAILEKKEFGRAHHRLRSYCQSPRPNPSRAHRRFRNRWSRTAHYGNWS